MPRHVRFIALSLALLLNVFAAHAATIATSAALSGPNENPPNASPATGATTVVLDTTTHQLRISVVFSGLTGPSTMSHIHCCVAPPGNTGVATALPAFPGFPLGVTSGSLDQVYDTTQATIWNPAFITSNGGTPQGAEAALAAGLAAGRAYLNIHTTTFPPGEIRGFLLQQSPPSAFDAIPTLSEWALGGLAVLLAVAAWSVMRQRTR
jgi:hypothetical protein